MIRRLFNRLRRDQRGVSIIEFALLAPTLMVMLFGLMDLAYSMYTSQMLQGSIQTAARQATMEGAASNSAGIDGLVITAVRTLSPNATLTFSRTSYSSFTEVGRPEDYTDLNTNGTCDANEPFEDANGNGNWDLDPGQAGFGGARDAVLYRVDVSYPRLFPIYAFIPGQSSTNSLSVSTVLRNQPYGQQDTAAPTLGNCA
ncbi:MULTISPECIES: TadE/TadG family type IV pilus assembly protein [unclassified Novosphingobium]|uniref:TadE/TadG family type IV pilus assembly protein n=1 Tax=unclassified Novosphingobium TaxID=2644732 RepID=UPI0025FD3FFC|nr:MULTISPECIES: TadE/TadG family type IV pilus assembly protein [unclassified Novosphingobium]HQV02681.1 pilus assembly protein [Novosphingobium sp.]